MPGVVVARNYTYMCSEQGRDLIKQDCEELGLARRGSGFVLTAHARADFCKLPARAGSTLIG